MRRRTAVRAVVVVVVAVLGLVAGCNDDDGLEDLLLSEDDLPEGFAPADDVNDTLTSFCATEDATAGLQASDRAVIGFEREGGGASVIELVFRFRDGGGPTFVEQAEAALSRCSGVPDVSGLAFEYEPLAPELSTLLEDAGDARTGRHGTSVGSGSLTVNVVVLHRGDVGILVAVLGLDLPRAELDALAGDAFGEVADRL